MLMVMVIGMMKERSVIVQKVHREEVGVGMRVVEDRAGRLLISDLLSGLPAARSGEIKSGDVNET
eukprot:132804-Hanusia_phi.AAC.1